MKTIKKSQIDEVIRLCRKHKKTSDTDIYKMLELNGLKVERDK